jgi:hypothetical protein
MSVELSQGSQIAIAATYAGSKTFSTISNAAEAVALFEAAHGIIVGDILEVTSGWELLNGAIVRVKTVATNDITFEGFDTTSTTRFPAGEGAGTAREISTWATITQVQQLTADNPGVEFVDITNLGNRVRKQIPGLENAPTLNFTIQYDSSLSWWATVLAASDANAQAAIRIITPGGRKVYSNAYWKMSRFPQLNTGQAITHVLTCVLSSPIPSSYAS